MSISQNHWRFGDTKLSEDQGFFISGRTEEDCYAQLKQYVDENPDKWILYYPCGLRPAKPVPIPEFVIEVRLRPQGDGFNRTVYPLSFFKVFNYQGEIRSKKD